jgi:hypothetical protein
VQQAACSDVLVAFVVSFPKTSRQKASHYIEELKVDTSVTRQAKPYRLTDYWNKSVFGRQQK